MSSIEIYIVVEGQSERLEALKSGYRKVAISKTVTAAIGIQLIREKCPHFNNWLTKFENLKAAPIEIFKRKKTTGAKQKLRGSGNGNLVNALLEEREKDKLR